MTKLFKFILNLLIATGFVAAVYFGFASMGAAFEGESKIALDLLTNSGLGILLMLAGICLSERMDKDED